MLRLKKILVPFLRILVYHCTTARYSSYSGHGDTVHSLTQRGLPPKECQDPNAGEKQGCYTLQDASGEDFKFALAPGKSWQSGESGQAGAVVYCVTKSGRDIAIKKYRKGGALLGWYPDDLGEGATRSWNVLRELKESPYIMGGLAKGEIDGDPALAMEIAMDGTLKTHVVAGEYEGRDNQNKMRNLADNLLDGFVLMHSKKFAHMDIQLPNIVLRGLTPKIVDFDYACKDQQECDYIPGGDAGLASPEALFEIGQGRANPYANDVWTLGSLFVQITTVARFPLVHATKWRATWETEDLNQRATLINERWPKFHPRFAKLLAQVFSKEDQRITMEEFREKSRKILHLYKEDTFTVEEFTEEE